MVYHIMLYHSLSIPNLYVYVYIYVYVYLYIHLDICIYVFVQTQQGVFIESTPHFPVPLVESLSSPRLPRECGEVSLKPGETHLHAHRRI